MITIILPAYNEELALEKTVLSIIKSCQEIELQTYEILIANDGSTDNTQNIIEDIKKKFKHINSITNKKNMGMGASFFRAVQASKYDRVTLFAADNVTTPYMIKNILKNHDKADLVFSYFINSEVRPLMRRIYSAIFCNMYCFFFGINLIYTHGPVIYPKNKLLELKIKSKSYDMFVEINVKLLRQGLSFFEVDGYVYPDPKKTGAIKLKNFLKIFWGFIRLFLEVYIIDSNLYNKSPRRILPKVD